MQVINDEPVRPSHLARRLPNDIQTICLKCLEKNPARRYDSADALADDLGRFLEDQPIVARHTSSMERGWRWCRRHPAKTSIALSIGAFLILVAVFSSLYSIQLGYQLKLTSQAKGKEQESKVNALSQLWESKLAQADAIRMSNQIGQRYDALKAIDAARALSPSIRFRPEQLDQMRNATIACLAKPDMRVDDQWEGHVAPSVPVLAFDGSHSIYACLKDRYICICRTKTGEEIARVSVATSKSRALLSNDGKRLAVLNDYCRVYTLEDEQVNLIYETPSKGVWGFAPDGTKILGTSGDGQLCLVDLRKPIVTKKLGTFIANNEIVISPDGRRITNSSPCELTLREFTAHFPKLDPRDWVLPWGISTTVPMDVCWRLQPHSANCRSLIRGTITNSDGWYVAIAWSILIGTGRWLPQTNWAWFDGASPLWAISTPDSKWGLQSI